MKKDDSRQTTLYKSIYQDKNKVLQRRVNKAEERNE
jgi:hypothetical protein